MKRVVEVRCVSQGKISDPGIRFTTTKKINDLFQDLTAVLKERWTGIKVAEVIGEKADEDTRLIRTGVTSFSTKGNIMTSMPVSRSDIQHTGRNSCIMGGIKSQNEPGRIKFITRNGEVETEEEYAFTVYPEGYVINTGKTGYSLFGAAHTRYLVSIGSRNVKTGAISAAHVYPTLQAVVKYLDRHKDTFRYLHEEYGYNIQIEPACTLFAADMTAIPDSDKKFLSEIESLLQDISKADLGNDEMLEGTASKEEMIEEAEKRLRKLGVMESPVIASLRDNKLFMSEFGGILYDLDENAREAVKNTESSDLLPYAVIKSNLSCGTCYSVLYVSNDKEAWYEERPDASGSCVSYVYNADKPFCSEYGEIGVQGANGGLVRIA